MARKQRLPPPPSQGHVRLRTGATKESSHSLPTRCRADPQNWPRPSCQKSSSGSRAIMAELDRQLRPICTCYRLMTCSAIPSCCLASKGPSFLPCHPRGTEAYFGPQRNNSLLQLWPGTFGPCDLLMAKATWSHVLERGPRTGSLKARLPAPKEPFRAPRRSARRAGALSVGN